MSGSFVQARNLHRHYGVEDQRVKALDGISLDVEEGEVVSLVGRSGSGKSTLINLLSGLDKPDSGSLIVNGRDLASMNADELADYRRHTVGLVFQAFHLVPSLSALANVELPLVFAGHDRKARREHAMSLLQRVGLDHRSGHLPSELSGGEQQRVAIARALVLDPPLLLADEPAGNLDSRNAEAVMEALIGGAEERLNRGQRRTVIMVTHDEAMARPLVDRLIRLGDGILIDDEETRDHERE